MGIASCKPILGNNEQNYAFICSMTLPLAMLRDESGACRLAKLLSAFTAFAGDVAGPGCRSSL